MKIFQVVLLALGLPSAAFAKSQLKCTHYIYADVPFVTITMNLTPERRIEPMAELTHYGQTRQTAIEERPVSENQMYNLIVDAGSPGGEVFLEIYKNQVDQATVTMKAKLINPQAPGVKEMPGQCELSD